MLGVGAAALFIDLDVLDEAGVGLDAAIVEAVRRVDGEGQRHRLVGLGDAGAAHAGIDVDDDAEARRRPARGPAHGRGQGVDVGRVVDDDGQIRRAVRQGGEARELRRADDGRRDVHARDVAGDHRLGLAQTGAADAKRAAGALAAGDGARFMGLGVRPDRDAGVGAEPCQRGHVALEPIEVEDEGRRRQPAARSRLVDECRVGAPVDCCHACDTSSGLAAAQARQQK